jgi:maleylacetate reductase
VSLIDAIDSQREDFVWKDGERLIAFGRSALASMPVFMRAAGLEDYVLLTTERADRQFSSIAAGGAEIAAGALKRIDVGPGDVAERAAELAEAAHGHSIVAVGGGRVIDTAKAIAAVSGAKVAAIPTTLSGAPMTSSHRLPAGSGGGHQTVRPAIVIADPELMASQPANLRTGSAMNALSHAIEALFVEGSSAIPRLAAARAAELLFRSIADENVDEPTRRQRLALGSIEAGYAVGATGYALHHVLCQSIVRTGKVPHAPTYGVMLPYTLEFYKLRDELTWNLISEQLDETDPSIAIARACARAGNPTTLTELGVTPDQVEAIVASAADRRELALTPGGATIEDIRQLIASAL